MKLHWICAVVTSLFVVLPASAKNSVYKGTATSTNLVTGAVEAFSIYLVLGDERPIDPGKDTYAFISGTYVFFGPPFGKKRYSTAPAGLFRTLELTETVNGKPRTAEIISQVAESSPTDSGDGGHEGRILVFNGVHTSPKYDTPKTLTGTGIFTFGTLGGEIPSGIGTRQTYKLTLVANLTDPIPTGESLADSVKRVTDFLESRGFVLVAP